MTFLSLDSLPTRPELNVQEVNSAIHKATGLKAPGLSMALTSTISMEQKKCSLAVNGSQRCSETVPEGGRQSGALVNSAVNVLTEWY